MASRGRSRSFASHVPSGYATDHGIVPPIHPGGHGFHGFEQPSYGYARHAHEHIDASNGSRQQRSQYAISGDAGPSRREPSNAYAPQSRGRAQPQLDHQDVPSVRKRSQSLNARSFAANSGIPVNSNGRHSAGPPTNRRRQHSQEPFARNVRESRHNGFQQGQFFQQPARGNGVGQIRGLATHLSHDVLLAQQPARRPYGQQVQPQQYFHANSRQGLTPTPDNVQLDAFDHERKTVHFDDQDVSLSCESPASYKSSAPSADSFNFAGRHSSLGPRHHTSHMQASTHQYRAQPLTSLDQQTGSKNNLTNHNWSNSSISPASVGGASSLPANNSFFKFSPSLQSATNIGLPAEPQLKPSRLKQTGTIDPQLHHAAVSSHSIRNQPAQISNSHVSQPQLYSQSYSHPRMKSALKPSTFPTGPDQRSQPGRQNSNRPEIQTPMVQEPGAHFGHANNSSFSQQQQRRSNYQANRRDHSFVTNQGDSPIMDNQMDSTGMFQQRYQHHGKATNTAKLNGHVLPSHLPGGYRPAQPIIANSNVQKPASQDQHLRERSANSPTSSAFKKRKRDAFELHTDQNDIYASHPPFDNVMIARGTGHGNGHQTKRQKIGVDQVNGNPRPATRPVEPVKPHTQGPQLSKPGGLVGNKVSNDVHKQAAAKVSAKSAVKAAKNTEPEVIELSSAAEEFESDDGDDDSDCEILGSTKRMPQPQSSQKVRRPSSSSIHPALRQSKQTFNGTVASNSQRTVFANGNVESGRSNRSKMSVRAPRTDTLGKLELPEGIKESHNVQGAATASAPASTHHDRTYGFIKSEHSPSDIPPVGLLGSDSDDEDMETTLRERTSQPRTANVGNPSLAGSSRPPLLRPDVSTEADEATQLDDSPASPDQGQSWSPEPDMSSRLGPRVTPDDLEAFLEGVARNQTSPVNSSSSSFDASLNLDSELEVSAGSPNTETWEDAFVANHTTSPTVAHCSPQLKSASLREDPEPSFQRPALPLPSSKPVNQFQKSKQQDPRRDISIASPSNVFSRPDDPRGGRPQPTPSNMFGMQAPGVKFYIPADAACKLPPQQRTPPPTKAPEALRTEHIFTDGEMRSPVEDTSGPPLEPIEPSYGLFVEQDEVPLESKDRDQIPWKAGKVSHSGPDHDTHAKNTTPERTSDRAYQEFVNKASVFESPSSSVSPKEKGLPKDKKKSHHGPHGRLIPKFGDDLLVELRKTDMPWETLRKSWQQSTGRRIGLDGLRKRYKRLVDAGKPGTEVSDDTSSILSKDPGSSSSPASHQFLFGARHSQARQAFLDRSTVCSTPTNGGDNLYGHPTIGGKTLSQTAWQAMIDEVEEMTDDEEIGRVCRQPSAITEKDKVHFEYRVCRRFVPRGQDDDDEVEWQNCANPTTNIHDANSAAAVESTRDWPEGFQSQEFRFNELGLSQWKFKFTTGSLEVHVKRSLRSFHDGKLPDSKEGWISTQCYMVFRSTKIFGASNAHARDAEEEQDDLFNDPPATELAPKVLLSESCNIVDTNVYTLRDQANKTASDAMASTKPRTSMKYDDVFREKQDRKYHLEVLQETEDCFDETFDMGDEQTVRIWVQVATLKGPRNV